MKKKQTNASEETGNVGPQRRNKFPSPGSKPQRSTSNRQGIRNWCFAAGAELDHETIAAFLDSTKDYFSIIKRENVSSEDRKPRTIQDNLGEVITYSQIRLVIACLIHNLEI